MKYGIMNGSSASEPAANAIAPLCQNLRSRQSLFRVRRIAAAIASGTVDNRNQVMVVNPVMKNANPSQAARLRLRSCTNSTNASNNNGTHTENRYINWPSMLNRYGMNAKKIPAIHPIAYEPRSEEHTS